MTETLKKTLFYSHQCHENIIITPTEPEVELQRLLYPNDDPQGALTYEIH